MYVLGVSDVLEVCCKSFIWTLLKYIRMLQVFQRYVVSVYSKCFICFKRMLQVFYLDVAYCSGYTHILQVFVLNVSFVSVVCLKGLDGYRGVNSLIKLSIKYARQVD
jgi:hypothetical protein